MTQLSFADVAQDPEPETERWLPVEGYEGLYDVSSFGRVRSLDRIGARPSAPRLKGKILKTPPSGGYPQVTFCKDRVKVHALVHHVIALTFIGPRPDGKVVCHGDGNPSNNRLSNLRYDFPKGNADDMVRHGRSKRGSTNKNAKLTEKHVLEIVSRSRTHRQGGTHQYLLAQEYGVSLSAIEAILSGKTWWHLTGL